MKVANKQMFWILVGVESKFLNSYFLIQVAIINGVWAIFCKYKRYKYIVNGKEKLLTAEIICGNWS